MKRAPRKIEMDSPCNLSELAKFCGLGKSTVYEHVRNGYTLQYPRIHRTTPAHFLKWAEGEPSEVRESAAERREREIIRLRSKETAGPTARREI